MVGQLNISNNHTERKTEALYTILESNCRNFEHKETASLSFEIDLVLLLSGLINLQNAFSCLFSLQLPDASYIPSVFP